MTQQTFNDGDSGLVVQGVINANATDAESRLTILEGDQHAAVTLNADDPTQETLNLSGQELQVNLATTSTDGAMSAADKSKLNGIASGAEVNPALISEAEIDAGTDTNERVISADRLRYAFETWTSEFTRTNSSDQTCNGNTNINFQNGSADNDHVTRISDNTYELSAIGMYEVATSLNCRKNNVVFGSNARFDGAIQLDSGGGFSDITEATMQNNVYNDDSDEQMIYIRAFINVTVASAWDVRVRVDGKTANSTVDTPSALFIRYLGTRP